MASNQSYNSDAEFEKTYKFYEDTLKNKNTVLKKYKEYIINCIESSVDRNIIFKIYDEMDDKTRSRN